MGNQEGTGSPEVGGITRQAIQDAIKVMSRRAGPKDFGWRDGPNRNGDIFPPPKSEEEQAMDALARIGDPDHAAMSIPFATLPVNNYIRGPKYKVQFDRIVTPKFTKDIFPEQKKFDNEEEEALDALARIGDREPRDWSTMDIRQILTDNAIKDMMQDEDTKFIKTINAALGQP